MYVQSTLLAYMGTERSVDSGHTDHTQTLTWAQAFTDWHSAHIHSIVFSLLTISGARSQPSLRTQCTWVCTRISHTLHSSHTQAYVFPEHMHTWHRHMCAHTTCTPNSISPGLFRLGFSSQCRLGLARALWEAGRCPLEKSLF